MKTFLNWLLFFSLIILSFCLDLSEENCKIMNTDAFMNSLLHHIFSTFMWFGPFLVGYYKLHILGTIVTAILWQIVGKCPVTIQYNHLCSNSSYSEHIDLANRFHKYTKIKMNYSILGIIIYDIYMIMYKNKK